MSSAVIRPAGPVPASDDSLIPFSLASRLTDGGAKGADVASAGCEDWGSTVSGVVGESTFDGAAAGVDLTLEGGVSSADTRNPITAPTGTTVPGFGASAGIRKTPASTASMSCAAFSPSSSKTASPGRMRSPSFYNHRTNVPSSMDQPSLGIVIVKAMFDYSFINSRMAFSIVSACGTTACSSGGL